MRTQNRIALWDVLGQVCLGVGLLGLVLVWTAGVLNASLSDIQLVGDEDEGVYAIVWTSARFIEPLRIGGAFLVLSAAVVAMVVGEYRRLGWAARLAIWTLVAVSVVWTVITYPKIPNREMFVSPTGTYLWLMPLTVALGMRRQLWSLLYPVLWVQLAVTAALALYSLLSFPSYARFTGVSPQVLYLNAMLWPAVFLPLRSLEREQAFAIGRLLPLIVCLMLAIFIQGRGWTLLCLIGLGLYFHRLRQTDDRWMAAMMTALGIAVIGGVAFLLLSRNLGPAFEGLLGRIGEETRIGQYQQFFSQIDIGNLIPGLGPHASYRMEDETEYQFFDNQYIWILFIGGLPALAAYGILILRPAGQIGLNPYHRSSRQAAAQTILLWALAMAGISTFMNVAVDFPNLMIALLAGRCYDQLLSRG